MLLNNLYNFAWLIPVLPLIAGAAIIFFTRKNRNLSSGLSIGAISIGLIYSLLLLLNKTESIYEVNQAWISIGNFQLDFGMLIDPLAIVMLLVVTSVSLLVQIYSHGYMSHDEGYSKFFAYLSLFSASMLALVISTNLFQMYVFWELVGLCSYLLIGFWHTRPASGDASLKAFVINRIGDFGFLIGILLLAFFSLHTGAYNPLSDVTFLGLTDLPILIKNIGPGLLSVIGILIFMGAMAKSAQFPLHTWLPDAMEGPTPISALIHAATMVAAGVFLIARCFPMYMVDGEPTIALIFIAVTGAFTALYAAIIALSQNDIKKALAYSTCSQLGLMVMSMGCGAWIAGMFHLVTHAYFKSLLFLGSGSVIHACDDEQDMRKMGGLHKYMPITSWTFLIATMAISSVPLLAGFWSKEQILHAAWHFGEGSAQWLFIISAFASMLTCFYMFRIYFMTFCGEYRGEGHPHESPKSITGPLLTLAVPSVLLGYLGTPLSALGGNHFEMFLTGASHGSETVNHFIHNLFTQPSNVIPLIGTVTFITIAYFTYYKRPLVGLKDKIKGTFLYQWSLNKFYLDEFYAMFCENIIQKGSRALYNLLDRTIINNIFVEGYAKAVQMKANIYSRLLQSGQVQGYLLFTLIMLVVILAVFSYIPMGAEAKLGDYILEQLVKSGAK